MQLEKIIDKKILPFICHLLSFLKRKKPINEKNKNILVIRFWGVGSAILCLPLLRTLKENSPDSKITVLCTERTSPVFFNQPFVDERISIWSSSVIPFIIKNFRKYDLVIDTEEHYAISALISFFVGKRSIGYNIGARAKLFDHNIVYNDRQHVVYTYCDLLKPLGITASPKELGKLNYDDDAKTFVSLRFQKQSIRLKPPVIGIHAFCGPTARWRAWPKERFASFIDKIKKKHSPMIILTGAGWEEQGNKEIIALLTDKSNVYNIANLPTQSLFYLIGQYDLMVSNDTGPMHIAAAQGVPTIGLFGPNTPQRFGPFPPEKHIALYHQTEGHPVINVHLNEFRECDGKCMELITVDEVLEAAEKLLKKK